MEENRVTEKVYCYDHPSAYNHDNSAMLAALLNKNDNPLEAAALMNGGHYDECFAKMAVSKMYYTEDKEKHYAPYWMRSEIESIWNKVKSELEESDYTMWDFYVTMNMLMSDNYRLLEGRYPNSSKDEKTKIIIEDAINYLNDEDNPFGSEKIWGYLNAKL